MAKNLSEFALDDKISTIRGTLSRLTLSFKSELKPTPCETSPAKPMLKATIQSSFSDSRICLGFPTEEIDPTQSVAFSKMPSILDLNILSNQVEELQEELKLKDSLLLRAQNDLIESRKTCASQISQINSLRDALRTKSKVKRKKSYQHKLTDDNLSTIDSASSSNRCDRADSILRQVMDEINAQDIRDIVPYIRALKKSNKLSHSQQRFVEKVGGLLIQFSPPHTFEGFPSVRAIWKWVRNLAEDYAKLKYK